MESLLMEAESATNLRRSSFSSTVTNNHSSLYWGLGFKSSQNPYNYSLPTLLNTNNNTMARYLPAAATSPTLLYSSSLPAIPIHHQPPLLPLPMKSATMPSPTMKIGVPPSAVGRSSSTAARQNSKQKRKKKQQSKPSTIPKKEPAKPMEKKEEEEETEEEFLIGSVSSVYSLSPPPSSLPLPRLLLMRPRRSTPMVAAVASSCIAEATAGVDAGATDDLRKLLRL